MSFNKFLIPQILKTQYLNLPKIILLNAVTFWAEDSCVICFFINRVNR